MSRLSRGVFILFVVLRYGLDELVLSSFRHPWLRLFTRILTLGRNLHAPRGERLREALERLGPIFVKFGQVLSTRRDLMPPDIAEELAKLQDRVPPFSSEVAVASSALSVNRWTSCSRLSNASRWPAPRLHRCILRRCGISPASVVTWL